MRFFFILTVLSVLAVESHAETKIILSNKAYSLVPDEQPPCSDGPGGPEYATGIFAMTMAQGLGDNTGGPTAGVKAMFATIRRYPSRFKAPNCAGPLRDECEKRCNKVQGFDPLECKIQCNQYESWNG